MDTTLVKFDAARRALAEARSIDEVKEVRDKAQALYLYAKQRDESHKMQNDIAEIKLRAERRLGELIDDMDKNAGGNPNLLQPATGSPPTYTELGIERTQAHRWQTEASLPDEDFERFVAETKDSGRELTSAALYREARKYQGGMAVHFSSDSSEWYTPQLVIDCVVQVLGGIDLDPCSNTGEPHIPAQEHFALINNGLSLAWFGSVYMNPPYGNVIKDWVEKLCSEYEAGHVSQAIALVPARTDTAWFRRMREYPRCFIWGRLRFSGQANSAPFPSMAVYLGDDLEAFIKGFGTIGDIYSFIG